MKLSELKQIVKRLEELKVDTVHIFHYTSRGFIESVDFKFWNTDHYEHIRYELTDETLFGKFDQTPYGEVVEFNRKDSSPLNYSVACHDMSCEYPQYYSSDCGEIIFENINQDPLSIYIDDDDPDAHLYFDHIIPPWDES